MPRGLHFAPAQSTNRKQCLFHWKPKMFKAALLILAGLTYALTFSAAPLRCNTAKTLQQL